MPLGPACYLALSFLLCQCRKFPLRGEPSRSIPFVIRWYYFKVMAVEIDSAWLANIRLHPIKGLDSVSVSEARIGPNGGLERDRVWVLFSLDGQWINGKRTAAIHRVRAEYDPNVSLVVLSASPQAGHSGAKLRAASFAFPDDFERAGEWFSEYFGERVMVRHVPEGAPDDGLATGPTVVSTASLQAVCDTFETFGLDQARERFRTTLEIDGVPAFWEDQLFGPEENYPRRFKIGPVAFEGSNPCARCPVPARNPHTGQELPGFQRKLTEMRRATLPSWSPADRFDHFYRLAVNTRVPSVEQGKLLRVGDALLR
jgi:MOSC domain-containing protein